MAYHSGIPRHIFVRAVICQFLSGFPGVKSDFKKIIENLVDNQPKVSVQYSQLTMQDRYAIQSITKPVDEFLNDVFTGGRNLKFHDFISRQQSAYLKEKKSTIAYGEYIFIMDFSENYEMVTQDEIQSAHFNKNHATLHPIIAYYKDTENILQNISWIGITDHLKHDKITVHQFQKKIIQYIQNKSQYPPISKIFYFTDGSAAQYKNRRNFSNLLNHVKDFNVSAEWNFFATAHKRTS